MIEIQNAVKEYADARSILSERVQHLNDEIETIKRRHIPGLRSAVAKTAEAESDLRERLAKHEEYFDAPKTRVFHGVRVGFRLSEAVLEWSDLSRVVDLIKRHFGDKFDFLVKTKTKYKLDTKALQALPKSDLSKIGISVEGPSNDVFVKASDSDVDKMVNALLKGASDVE